MSKKSDHYALLSLRRDASSEEIRRAYYDAARRLHPDKTDSARDYELFLEIQEAYQVLADLKKRAKYDASLPPEPAEGDLIRQNILYSRQEVTRTREPQLIYVLLEYSAAVDESSPSAPPLNLCLVLDRSTSMRGKSMDVVKATAIQLLRRLRPEDTLSIVTFSDRAETIIPATENIELKKLEARIQMLQTSGGTEIFQGLESGYNEVLRGLKESCAAPTRQVNHIILLTDGRTYGDEERCLELARKAAEDGIGISGLGIGNEWNDDFLDKLASLTGGSSLYVSRPQDIQHILLEKFNNLSQVYAKESTLEFKLSEGVDLRYAFRLQPEAGLLPVESPLRLGPILKDSDLKILMELILQPPGDQTEIVSLLEGELKASVPTQPYSLPPIRINLVRPVSNSSGLQTPPEEILQALSHLTLYRLQEQACLEVAAGDYTKASQRLQRLAIHLIEQGERGLARTALLEAENIQRKYEFTEEGKKQIKYGTRALLLPGQKESPA
ncbi:MAG: VWA domain-containing protein [Anaerolineales bacterium]|nr:VWA domain-containing protein [Anaerolineales bacterium]